MANHSFYVDKKWRHKREVILRNYNYEDQEAKRYGKTVLATMVHHIYPVSEYPELRYKSWNLLPLSLTSHNKMHDRVTDEITEKGKYWQGKRILEFENFYKNSPPHL